MLKWHDLVGYPVPTPQSISQYWEKWHSRFKWDQMVKSNRPNPTHNSPIIATCLPVKYLVNTVTYEINLRVCFIVTLTWDQYNQICQTSPARSPCTIPYFCACWSYLGSWSCKGVMATVRSDDTHSTKVSEVPSPEGKGIRLLLKMFLPLYWSLLNQMHHLWLWLRLQHSDSFILSFAPGTLGDCNRKRLSKYWVFRFSPSTSNSSKLSYSSAWFRH